MTTIILELWSDPKQSMDQSIKIRFVSFDGVFLSQVPTAGCSPYSGRRRKLLFCRHFYSLLKRVLIKKFTLSYVEKHVLAIILCHLVHHEIKKLTPESAMQLKIPEDSPDSPCILYISYSVPKREMCMGKRILWCMHSSTVQRPRSSISTYD